MKKIQLAWASALTVLGLAAVVVIPKVAEAGGSNTWPSFYTQEYSNSCGDRTFHASIELLFGTTTDVELYKSGNIVDTDTVSVNETVHLTDPTAMVPGTLNYYYIRYDSPAQQNQIAAQYFVRIDGC